MKAIRPTAVALAAFVLVVAPVITPVWAAPHPVAPSVHRMPLTGVDTTALQSAPPALAPGSAAQPGGNSAAKGNRVTPTDRPAVFTPTLDTGRFTAAGVSWSASADPGRVAVQIRVRENASWSDWRVLDEEGGPDAGSVEARSQGATGATQPYSLVGVRGRHSGEGGHKLVRAATRPDPCHRRPGQLGGRREPPTGAGRHRPRCGGPAPDGQSGTVGRR